VIKPGDDLTPLAGVVVQYFPATLQDLRLLTNNRAMANIAAYGTSTTLLRGELQSQYI